MTTYKESGVDVKMGDRCSKLAYSAAKETFPGRKGMVGEPVVGDGGFAGLLDMGDFYLVQNDDGVGTKMEVAEKTRKFDTLGYDLLAMVADDAICVGAEVISVTNTLDVPKLEEVMVEGLMKGLRQAALEQKIVVPGGELAELGGALNGAVWNATAVGIVAKGRVLDGSGIVAGDAVIGLKSAGIRSNGLTLARAILRDQYGEDWVSEKYGNGETWGEVILRPSKIYHRSILNIIGSYGEEKEHAIKGLVHNTGGGIRGNLPRLLKPLGLGAKLDALIEPRPFMLKLMELGGVSLDEAYQTWNMGVGMMMVTGADDADAVLAALQKEGIEAQVMGYVAGGTEIQF
jgi:phosphoribosylformylglycinamidine cyclo-ligase